MPSKPAKNPDPDWDDVITRFVGQDFAGCFTDGQSLEFGFKSGRKFILSGDGQRHKYTLEGEASGKLLRASAVRCTSSKSAEGYVSVYVGRLESEGGDLEFQAVRETEERPKEGFRFRFRSEKQAPRAPEKGKKPVFSVRVG